MLSPLKILQSPYSAILLNQNGIENKGEFTKIWNNAAVRVAVDGGTNCWYALHRCDDTLKRPNIVSGDFDSIKPEVLEYVKGLADVKVVPTPDQDETDYTKAFQILGDLFGATDATNTIITLTSNKIGRFDQQISTINTLIKSTKTSSQMYLYDYQNLVFALRPNEPREILLRAGLTCGIIPIDGPSVMTTRGLKWNLDGTYGFGDIVSTSNVTMEDVISVNSNRVFLMTMEVSLTP